MATTAESFQDALRWIGRFLRMAARRAAVMAVLIVLFALAVWWTTRERVSDCGDVTVEQRVLLDSLLVPDEARRFRVATSASCVDGRYSAPVLGLSGEMESASAQLVADGLELDVEFIPFYQDRWRRCFRFPDPAFERIELNVWSNRAGEVEITEVVAPEDGDACDFLRY